MFITEDYTCINGALCWDCNIIIYLFIYGAKLWAEKVNRLCTMEEAGFLRYKFLCQDHVLPIDFTTPEGICLKRLAVPCGLDLASHSIPQSSPPCYLPYNYMCGWKLSDITFNCLMYCSGLNFSKWSRQWCICKYLIRVMYLCHPLWHVCLQEVCSKMMYVMNLW